MTAARPVRIGVDARMFGSKTPGLAGREEPFGIGVYTENLVSHLTQISPPTIEYVLFTKKELASSLEKKYPRAKIVPTKTHWYTVGEQTILPLIFKKAGLDLLHIPHFNAPLVYAGRVVVTIHDLIPFDFPGHLASKNSLRFKAFEAVFSRSVKKAVFVIAASKATRDQLLRRFPDLEQKKIRIIYQGIRKLEIRPRSQRSQLNLLKKLGVKKPYIFYTGVWRPHKNLDGLLEAFVLVQKKTGSKYQLVIGGSPHPIDKKRIGNLIKRLGLANYVLTTGFVEEEVLAILYRQAAVVVLPSLLEGFGHVGLEAASLGTPVAAAKTGSLSEILNGLAEFFNPRSSEEIAHAILAAGAKQRRERHITETALARFSWRECARQTLNIYNEAIR